MMKKILPLQNAFHAGPAGVVVLATWVDSKGLANIITLGMYMVISLDPPLVCIGVSPNRYSHDLIVESGEFTINVPSINLEKQVHFCGTNSGKNLDKFAETALTPVPALKVKPPLIDECYGHLECKLIQSHVCGDHTLFIGEVIAASVNEAVLTKGRMDPLKARPMTQKNYVYYAPTLLKR
jgi:flavin reductase (DIM6/NTAB) family NADH-FMN oxidoreductase RutF